MNEQKVNEQNIERELQEKLAAYRLLESRFDDLARQQNMFATKILEVQNTIASIDEIENGKRGREEDAGKIADKMADKKDILFNVGSSTYINGTIDDKNKFVVEVGADVALEKTAEEAKAVLEERKKELQKAIEFLQKDMQSISEALQSIETDAQKMINRIQQEKEKERVRIVPPE